MTKPKQIDSLEILNNDDRIFKSWGTVEVRDKEGDLIPISEFQSVMPVIMKRGGIITDRHTNRVIAKILNYEFKQKMTKEGPKDGIMITGNVFKDYKVDDMVWEGIKQGIYKGLSFGGMNHQLDTKYEKGVPTNILKKLEGFEFALVPGMGNQEATMEEVNYLAKCDKEIESLSFTDQNEIKKRLDNIEKKLDIKKQDTDDKDKEKTLTKNHLSLSPESDKSEKYIKKLPQDINMEDKNIKKEEIVETPQGNEPSNPMDEMMNVLKQILQAVSNNQVAKEADEDKDKDKDEDKKVEKANGAEGEKSVTLPKTPEEDTGAGEPAQGAETDEVKFVQKMNEMKKDIIQEIKKGLMTPGATTPRPAQEIKKQEVPKVTSYKDAAKMALGLK